MHRRWGCRNARAGRPIFSKLVIEEARKSTGNTRLGLCCDALLQLPCILIHKAQQDVLTPQALAHMTNARMLYLHPGIDHSLKRRHTIATLSAIKAFEPIHRVTLSVSNAKLAFHQALITLFRTGRGYCIIILNILATVPDEPDAHHVPADEYRVCSIM